MAVPGVFVELARSDSVVVRDVSVVRLTEHAAVLACTKQKGPVTSQRTG